MTNIRCYRTECKYNGFEKSNCGYCKLLDIYLTKEGCADYVSKLKIQGDMKK